jgi:hypothetical protein
MTGATPATAATTQRTLQSLTSRISNSLSRLEKETLPGVRAVTNNLGGNVPRSLQGGQAEVIKKSEPDSHISALAALADRLDKAISYLNEEARIQHSLIGQNDPGPNQVGQAEIG